MGSEVKRLDTGLPNWLRHARAGDSFWIENRRTPSIAGDAFRLGKRVKTQTYYAVHPSTCTVREIVRIEMVGDVRGLDVFERALARAKACYDKDEASAATTNESGGEE